MGNSVTESVDYENEEMPANGSTHVWIDHQTDDDHWSGKLLAFSIISVIVGVVAIYYGELWGVILIVIGVMLAIAYYYIVGKTKIVCNDDTKTITKESTYNTFHLCGGRPHVFVLGKYADFKECAGQKLPPSWCLGKSKLCMGFEFSTGRLGSVEIPSRFLGANTANYGSGRQKRGIMRGVNKWWKASPHYVESAEQSQPTNEKVEPVVIVTNSTTTQDSPEQQIEETADVVVVTE